MGSGELRFDLSLVFILDNLGHWFFLCLFRWVRFLAKSMSS